MRVSSLFVVLLAVLTVGLGTSAQAQTVSGFEHTSFNLSFDASSVDQIGNDTPDLVFRDVTFGAGLPLTDKLGIWVSVSRAADFNRRAEARKLTGAFAGGLSYVLAQHNSLTLSVLGGVLSRLERVGDRELNPTALRMGAKIGYRVLGEPGESRWFGLFLQGGSDLAMRDIMSTSDGNVMKGDTTYHLRLGLEFSM